jgi:hypothetical protein
VIKKNRSDRTKRRKRDIEANYTPDFTSSNRRVSTAETLRYRLCYRLSSKGKPAVTKAVTVPTRPVVHPGVLRRFVASSACRSFINVIA